jgi:hypothetical protein
MRAGAQEVAPLRSLRFAPVGMTRRMKSTLSFVIFNSYPCRAGGVLRLRVRGKYHTVRYGFCLFERTITFLTNDDNPALTG